MRDSPGASSRACCVRALVLHRRRITKLICLMTALLVSAAFLTNGCASGRATTSGAPSAAPSEDAELNRIAGAVRQVLPPGVRLLSVGRQGESIVLDFSNQLLAAGTGELEDTLHRLLTVASSSRTSRSQVEDYRILVNGVPPVRAASSGCTRGESPRRWCD
jgi:hypothetical protein